MLNNKKRLKDYNLLNRDNLQLGTKKSLINGNVKFILAMLEAPKEEFQKLIDKNLFNIQIDGQPLKSDTIVALGDCEPEVIDKVVKIMSLNPEMKIKEALALSELSDEDVAKIQKFNLFEEEVYPRLFSSDIDGDMVFMLSAFRNAKNENKEYVKLKPAEIVKIAQQPESAIPNLLKLLKNEKIEKYAFEELIKIAKLDNESFDKVESIITEANKEDGSYLLTYSIKENGNEAQFDQTAYEHVKQLNKILDEPAYADVIIRYCENLDGTHNSAIAERLIKVLADMQDPVVISEMASLAKMKIQKNLI